MLATTSCGSFRIIDILTSSLCNVWNIKYPGNQVMWKLKINLYPKEQLISWQPPSVEAKE